MRVTRWGGEPVEIRQTLVGAHRVDVPVRAGTEVPVEVWVPGAEGGIDELAHRSGGIAHVDEVVRAAHATGQRVLEYAQREFGRSSFDGRGTALKLRVHAPDPLTNDPRSNNAYWFDDEQRIWLGDGDGVTFAPLGGGADVVAHEFFHGVVDAEAGLSYLGQQGALHESFADVLATGIDGNWQIGEDVYTPGVPGDALRDLSRLRHLDWRTFPGGEDDVHAMSEIPSHAAYLVGSSIGAHELRRVWYEALTDHMSSDTDFTGARDATIAAARALYGSRSTQARAVVDAWTAVGVLDATVADLAPPVAAPQGLAANTTATWAASSAAMSAARASAAVHFRAR